MITNVSPEPVVFAMTSASLVGLAPRIMRVAATALGRALLTTFILKAPEGRPIDASGVAPESWRSWRRIIRSAVTEQQRRSDRALQSTNGPMHVAFV